MVATGHAILGRNDVVEDNIRSGVYHFEQRGPTCLTLQAILAPNSVVLPPSLQALGKEKGRENLICPALDLSQECGPEVDRVTSVSQRIILQHRLGHISRSGPADSAFFILDNFLMLEVERIIREYGIQAPGSKPRNMKKFPGTTEYYKFLKRRLHVMKKWLGPMAWLVTLTMDCKGIRCLAAWVRHYGGSAKWPVQVWLRKDEIRLLTSLMGDSEPEFEERGGEDVYFTHTDITRREDRRVDGEEEHTDEMIANCPYHNGCWRQPLEAWRHRGVQLS